MIYTIKWMLTKCIFAVKGEDMFSMEKRNYYVGPRLTKFDYEICTKLEQRKANSSFAVDCNLRSSHCATDESKKWPFMRPFRQWHSKMGNRRRQKTKSLHMWRLSRYGFKSMIFCLVFRLWNSEIEKMKHKTNAITPIRLQWMCAVRLCQNLIVCFRRVRCWTWPFMRIRNGTTI